MNRCFTFIGKGFSGAMSVLSSNTTYSLHHGRASTGRLPSPHRLVRTLCSRGRALLLFLLLLCCSGAVLLLSQRDGSTDQSPIAAPREVEQQPYDAEVSRTLPTFLKDITPSTDRHNIYQVVTSSPDTLKGRHYCSLESFCHHNRGSVVWLLLLGQDMLVEEPLRVLRQLGQTYPNLQLAQLDLWIVIRGTPLQDILASGQLKRSKYPINHLSDVLRLGVVYKAGGLYTDFDFICRKSVQDIRNTMALAVPDRAMNGLFHFEARHPFLKLLLQDAGQHFDGSQWSHNGPLLFTRTAKAFCPQFQFLGEFTSKQKSFDLSDLLTGLTNLLTGKNKPPSSSKLRPSSSHIKSRDGRSNRKAASEVAACYGVGLLNTTEFMPISQADIGKAFQEESPPSLAKAVGQARGFHLFNYLTGTLPIPGGSLVGQAMVQHCPSTIGVVAGLGMEL